MIGGSFAIDWVSSERVVNRLHLFAFAAAILVPLIPLASFLATEFAGRERERHQEVAKALATDIAADVDRELDSTIAALQALSTSPALRNGDLEAFDRHRSSLVSPQRSSARPETGFLALWSYPVARSSPDEAARTRT